MQQVCRRSLPGEGDRPRDDASGLLFTHMSHADVDPWARVYDDKFAHHMAGAPLVDPKFPLIFQSLESGWSNGLADIGKPVDLIGGVDGTRTRDPRRDRPVF